jgi:hypothetical protein
MKQSGKIQLEKLMELAIRSADVKIECACAISSFAGWERVPLSFPEPRVREIGNLMDATDEEPSFVEFHPFGTQYWSKNAPIALKHFPYNRCTVWECVDCGRCCLRYTEGGGYYVEKRIRALSPELIVDAPL